MVFNRGTPEEREARRQEHAARRADAAQRAQLEQAEQAFWASPRGQSRAAKAAGQRYFQIEIPLALTARTFGSMLLGDVATTERRFAGQGAVLTEIEEEGWQLFQAGFVFQETGAVSRDKFLSSGQSVQTTGHTAGVYLFRATDEPARTDRPWIGALEQRSPPPAAVAARPGFESEEPPGAQR